MIQAFPDAARATLGERIRSFRRARSLTQAQLASGLAVTKNAVTNWESGASRPDLSLLPPLCRLLGVTADELLGIPSAAALTRAEREHVALYRRLTAYDRANIDTLARSMLRGYDQAWLEEKK